MRARAVLTVIATFAAMGAAISGTSLARTNLSGADLAGALGLTQFQLSAACGDEATRLPPDFTVPRCD